MKAEDPLGYPGEQVKVFARSGRGEGWSRFPYVPPLSGGRDRRGGAGG